MPSSSGVAEGLDLFRRGGEVLVLAIFHFALIDKELKVGVVLDGAGRADAEHLHLAGHAFSPMSEFITSSASPSIRRFDEPCLCW